MSKQVFKTPLGVNWPFIPDTYIDLELNVSASVWNDTLGYKQTSKGRISKFTVQILTAISPIDYTSYLTVNGEHVYPFTIKTTDNGTLEFTPNIAFNENDILGYFQPDNSPLGELANCTLVVELEYD